MLSLHFKPQNFYMPSIFLFKLHCDTILQLSCRLSQIPAPVATTSLKRPRNISRSPKTAVPLRSVNQQYKH